MKVLFVCGAGLFSGLEKVTLAVMQGLQSSGFQVACGTSSWGDGEFYRRTVESGIECRRLRIGFISKTLTPRNLWMTFHQLIHLPGLWWCYWRILRHYRPDVVVHTNFHHLVVLWPFLQSGRDVYYVHNSYQNTDFYRRLFAKLGQRLGRFICVSHFVARSLADLGVPDSKLRVVHNGVPIPSIGRLARKEAYGGVSSPVQIGIVGQVGAWKGHDVLVDALQLVKQRGLAFRLQIFGEGEECYKVRLRDKIRNAGVEERVTWHGFVSDLDTIYCYLDLCVVPSVAVDSFPLSAVEPAAYATPLIASRIGGLPEIVVDGRTGLLHEPGRAEELAERLSTLINHRNMRARMGIAARARAENVFSEQRMVAAFAGEIGTFRT